MKQMRRLRSLQKRGSKGAALVEFSIVMLLFITLLFGIMEAGWAFSQSVEIRNAAREGARIAVIDYGTASEIAVEVCNRAGITGAGTTVAIVLLPDETSPESVQITVQKVYQTLTGFLPVFEGKTLSSVVEMRIERELVDLTANGGTTCV